MSLEAQNALFALFAVKLELISEGHVERALGKLEEGQGLAAALQAEGRISAADVERVVATADPEIFPGYRIEAEAGRGGMGVVYRACQLSMDRPVALKVLTRRLSQDEAYVEKFLIEARSAAKLNHEHIVAAIDAGSAADLHYFAMEFVDGCTVADLLDEDKLPWVRAFEIGEQVARALGHAHQAGLVHRDVKPENILVTPNGLAKLCDLGLAKPSQIAGTGEKADTTEGTPYYCSPEQALGRTDIDPKSDIYSLGVTIYTMMTGEPPFDGDSPRAILLKQVKEEFPNLVEHLPDVPEPYRQLIADMVIKDRAKRLESAEVFAERLASARREVTNSGRTIQSAPARSPVVGPLLIGVGVLFAIAIVLGIGLSSGDPPPSPTPEASAIEPPSATPSESPRGPVRVGSPVATPNRHGDEGLRQAKQAFGAAVAYAKNNPTDAAGAASRYAKVARDHPGTGYASRAEVEAERLGKEAGRNAQRALDTLSNRVLTMLTERRFQDAADLVETFRASWTDRGDTSVEVRLKRIDAQVRRQADSRATVVEAILAKEPSDAAAITELEGLASLLPEASQRRARASLAAAKKRFAGAHWVATYGAVLDAFEREGVSAAQATLEAAKRKPGLESHAAQVSQTLSDLAAAGQASRGLDRGLRGLSSRGEVSLRLASGQVLVGRVSGWDTGRGATFTLKTGGDRPLRARDLAPEELMPWILPPAQGRASALLLLSRGLPAAAALAYDRYLKAGGVDVPTLAERIELRRSVSAEAAAAAALMELLAPGLAPAELTQRASRFPANWRRTAAFKQRYAELRARFLTARGEELSKSPAALFKGNCKVDRRGKATLSYDFSTADQARDFRASPTHHKGSSLKVVEGALVVKGVVFVEARFLPGTLRVVYKVRGRDRKAPNLNLWLGADAGAWEGVFCGVGCVFTGVDSLKIDTQARKRAGYVVDLPAHALIQLAGKAPERRMPGVLAADIKPSLSRGKTIRVTVTTSEKGKVKVKIGSRIPLNASVAGLAQSPPSRVALAPLDSSIEVIELELVGKLDPVWLAERAKTIAESEAVGLPGPL
ncbi:MAG: serine/threonine protein kinase [Planctomycetes bacterium]|nr:serine/threonine protein kinase [Planctomycetota bacterium]